MLPDRKSETALKIIKMPSMTYKIDFKKKRAKGYFDEVNSLVQTIYKILMTKRYVYAIYDWNYGFEIDDLIGMPKGFVKAEIENRIIDALSIDDRIEKVYDFEFSDIKNDKFSLEVKFKVLSIFGDFDFEMEV